MEFFDFDQLYTNKQYSYQKAVASIGVFDGLHIGHQKIIEHALLIAKEIGDCDSVVFTFAQNPKMMIGRNSFSLPLLTTRMVRNIYDSLGVDKVVVIDFSPDFSKLTGEEFIARLTSLFDIRAIVVGDNFRCGQNADTTPQEIASFINKYTKNASVIVPNMYRLSDGTVDSSTLVRTAILDGNVATCATLLGRNYSLDLAHIPSRKNEWPLKVSIGSFVQLLPPPGEYEALLVLHDFSSLKVLCKINEFNVILSLVDEQRELEMLHSKRETPRYDRLEFIKELS